MPLYRRVMKFPGDYSSGVPVRRVIFEIEAETIESAAAHAEEILEQIRYWGGTETWIKKFRDDQERKAKRRTKGMTK